VSSQSQGNCWQHPSKPQQNAPRDVSSPVYVPLLGRCQYSLPACHELCAPISRSCLFDLLFRSDVSKQRRNAFKCMSFTDKVQFTSPRMKIYVTSLNSMLRWVLMSNSCLAEELLHACYSHA